MEYLLRLTGVLLFSTGSGLGTGILLFTVNDPETWNQVRFAGNIDMTFLKGKVSTTA